MAAGTWRRGSAAVAGGIGVAFALAACGGSSTPAATSTASGGGSADCASFADYGKFEGKTVEVYSSIRDIEAKRFDDAFVNFTKRTGITIKWNGTGEFETQLPVRVKGGNAPDLATIPQPGLLQSLVKDGAVKKAGTKVAEQATANFSKDWLAYGTIDGTLYAPPLGANVKSFVWYSPKDFADNGYAVPQTWDEMIKLSDTIAGKGEKPWCAGIESGVATGWVATDWLEDVLLRTQGAEVYDQWVKNDVAFNDPKIVAAINQVGAILKNDKYMNGGFGDVKSIASTSFQEGGSPILTGDCYMHRQASFYANQWKKGTKVAEDGDVFAFYLPPIDASKGKPVLGAGEFLAAFNEKPETQAVQLYMNSEEFVNSKAKIGDWITANNKLKVENVLTAGTTDPNPINVASVKILQDPNAVFRFDGSDQMPPAVNGAFWKQMTSWITGGATSQAAADAIQKARPAS